MQAGYVYLAHNPENGLYKIGFTTDPRSRIATLRSGGAIPVRFVSFAAAREGRQLERIAHRCFEGRRVRGEWFALDASQAANFWKVVRARADALGLKVTLLTEGEAVTTPSHHNAGWVTSVLGQPESKQGELFDFDAAACLAADFDAYLAGLAPEKSRKGKGGGK